MPDRLAGPMDVEPCLKTEITSGGGSEDDGFASGEGDGSAVAAPRGR